MQVLDSANAVIRSPEVVAYLHARVLAEPQIAANATALVPEPQEWGSSGLHFGASSREGEPLLLKLHVPPDQLWWTRALADHAPGLVPRVYAAGRLEPEGLGWVLSERVAGGLHPGLGGREFDLLLEAGVAFQIAARSLAGAAEAAGVLHTLRVDDLAERIEPALRRGAPGPAAEVLRRLHADWDWVVGVCEREVCHGDLHMANALVRDESEGATALVIDFHPTRMPWACDPAKPEILNAEPTRVGCRNLVAKQAAIRRRQGLSAPDGAELARLEAIVLGWWALQMWAWTGPDTDPAWRDPRIWRAENEAYITAAATS